MDLSTEQDPRPPANLLSIGLIILVSALLAVLIEPLYPASDSRAPTATARAHVVTQVVERSTTPSAASKDAVRTAVTGSR